MTTQLSQTVCNKCLTSQPRHAKLYGISKGAKIQLLHTHTPAYASFERTDLHIFTFSLGTSQ